MPLEYFVAGMRVKYTPFVGCDPGLIEFGTVTSKNHMYVFVSYDGDIGSKATKPEDLSIA